MRWLMGLPVVILMCQGLYTEVSVAVTYQRNPLGHDQRVASPDQVMQQLTVRNLSLSVGLNQNASSSQVPRFPCP